MIKKGLGKGLGALIPGYDESDVDVSSEHQIINLDIENVTPDSTQPRKNFDVNALTQLADSVRLHGIIQPILVRAAGEGKYIIIAGERRWRAARIAGLQTIPAMLKDAPGSNIMELALIENLQREDLNPLEEAAGYCFLMETYNLTYDDLSKRIGKSNSTIMNTIRLMKLPQNIQDMVFNGLLSEGHARALITVPDAKYQFSLAQKIVAEGLSVRATEKLAKQTPTQRIVTIIQPPERVQYIESAENRISAKLGTKVKINPGKKKNKIEIEYYSNEDLERILSILDK